MQNTLARVLGALGIVGMVGTALVLGNGCGLLGALLDDECLKCSISLPTILTIHDDQTWELQAGDTDNIVHDVMHEGQLFWITSQQVDFYKKYILDMYDPIAKKIVQRVKLPATRNFTDSQGNRRSVSDDLWMDVVYPQSHWLDRWVIDRNQDLIEYPLALAVPQLPREMVEDKQTGVVVPITGYQVRIPEQFGRNKNVAFSERSTDGTNTVLPMIEPFQNYRMEVNFEEIPDYNYGCCGSAVAVNENRAAGLIINLSRKKDDQIVSESKSHVWMDAWLLKKGAILDEQNADTWIEGVQKPLIRNFVVTKGPQLLMLDDADPASDRYRLPIRVDALQIAESVYAAEDAENIIKQIQDQFQNYPVDIENDLNLTPERKQELVDQEISRQLRDLEIVVRFTNAGDPDSFYENRLLVDSAWLQHKL